MWAGGGGGERIILIGGCFSPNLFPTMKSHFIEYQPRWFTGNRCLGMYLDDNVSWVDFEMSAEFMADELTYLWIWRFDSNTYEAEAISPS